MIARKIHHRPKWKGGFDPEFQSLVDNNNGKIMATAERSFTADLKDARCAEDEGSSSNTANTLLKGTRSATRAPVN